MYVQRLMVNNYGAIRQFDMRLPKGIAVIDCIDPHAIISALRILLLYAPLNMIDPPVTMRPHTKLFAEVKTGSLKYHVLSQGRSPELSAAIADKDEKQAGANDAYRAFMRRSAEENRICVFDPEAHTDFGLDRYLHDEKYFCPGELARMTNGMGTTDSFRIFLKKYRSRRSVAEAIGNDNAFRFMDAARFWDGFGKLRDIHYEGKPLLIKEPSPDLQRLLIENYHDLDRQLFLINKASICRTEKS